MSNGEDIWRQRLWVWLPAMVFFLANLIAFSVYRLGYAGDVQSLESRLEERSQALREVQSQRAERERLIGQTRLNRDRMNQLYEERFSTRRRRLTGITAEVKELARKSGLEPREISYQEQEIEDFGLVKRSFVFSVQGDYPELRTFINLLELSESFLTLEEVNLSGDNEGPELRISLKLSTLFAKEGEAPEVAATPPGAAP
jgi:Tfp pilus assembly protein PilO